MYEQTYISGTSLPDDAEKRVPSFVRQRLCGSIGELFVELRQGMPKSYLALLNNYSNPAVGHLRVAGKSHYELVIPGQDRNLIGSFHLPTFFELYGVNQAYKWLPESLRSWYAFLDGLCIVRSGGMSHGLDWYDLPLSYPSRRTLLEYQRMLGLPNKAIAKAFSGRDKSGIRLWIHGSEGDDVFVDEASLTPVLLHVRRQNLDEVNEIKDASVIDAYCAHMLAGGKAGEFDFRCPPAETAPPSA